MVPVSNNADICLNTDSIETGAADEASVFAASVSVDDVRWLSEPEQEAWRAYIRLAKMLMRLLDRDLHPFGLSTNDYEILVELSEAPDHRLRMTELADRTAQSRSRLSHQVTRMEAKGLIRRDACPGDKRGTFAVITPRGIATIERVAPFHLESVRRHFMDHLSPEQLSMLTDAYRPVLNQIRDIRDLD
jgi:DNA-binding MarR family transcriptional regulator